jgi:transcriptional regulator with XRE-family HTH domain
LPNLQAVIDLAVPDRCVVRSRLLRAGSGVTFDEISRIERGQQTVSMEQYEGIARAIGCDVDDILPDDLRDQLKQKNTCELPVLEMLPHSGPATWTRKLCLPVTENLWRENRYYFRAFSEYLGPHIMARDLLLCEWRPVKFHEAREGSIYTYLHGDGYYIGRLKTLEDENNIQIHVQAGYLGSRWDEVDLTGTTFQITGVVLASFRFFEPSALY